MPPDDARAQARRAIATRAWSRACALFGEVDSGGAADVGPAALLPADLESWGLAALLVGADAESDALRERAHYAFLDAGDPDGAARVAFWLGLALLIRGEPARGSGWFGRMRAAADLAGRSASVWAGYECVNAGMRELLSGRAEASLPLFEQALRTAAEHGDPSLQVLAGNGHGQALLDTGSPQAGLAELDEVMVLATTAAVSPQAVGLVYCAVISVCRDCLDLNRSAEWTQTLDQWCADQPDLVPYRGQCLVHRSEILQLRGKWQDAGAEVDAVISRLAQVPQDLAAGPAHYRVGELCRLRGDLAAAEAAYREAVAAGADPQPGLALLRLAQGRTGPALAGIRRALGETGLRFARLRLLPAAVEIAVAAAEVELATELCEELGEAAAAQGTPYLVASADTARGAVALANGDPATALDALRRAAQTWHALEAPYETARCRVLVARACEELGDPDAAGMELQAARAVFTALGADPDLRALGSGHPRRTEPPSGLTPRETEILRLVATGATNREVARNLVLSEHTVARHVANIFLKLQVSSRAAATAFAYDHGIV